MSLVLDALVVSAAWTHVLLAPYTKVEESFNLHAVHDVLMYGISPSALPNYDHFVFPGAVPRTFIGSVLLAWLSKPVIILAASFDLLASKFELQVIVRLVLATVNAIGLCFIRHAVSRRFGRPTSLYYTLLTCSQFHVPFWMGRTLPNMLAFLPVNLAAYLLIDRAPNALKPSKRSVSASIALLVFSAVVFRAEIAALGAALILQSLYAGHISFRRAFVVGAVSSLASIGLTVAVDSYFWQQAYLWPEFHSIYFNVVEGKSVEWGVSPFHAYLTSHLPKLLLTALPLSFFAVFSSAPRRLLPLIFPGAVLTAAMSAIGHKEWRFIVYVVPTWNVVAARGLSVMFSRRKSSLFGRLLFLGGSGAIAANLAATVLLTVASSRNYPGGSAMSVLNSLPSEPPVRAHVCNLALQSGASLFTHIHAPPYPQYLPSAGDWDAVPSLSPSPAAEASSAFGFLGRKKKEEKVQETGWEPVGEVSAFERWALDVGSLKGQASITNANANATGGDRRYACWIRVDGLELPTAQNATLELEPDSKPTRGCKPVSISDDADLHRVVLGAIAPGRTWKEKLSGWVRVTHAATPNPLVGTRLRRRTRYSTPSSCTTLNYKERGFAAKGKNATLGTERSNARSWRCGNGGWANEPRDADTLNHKVNWFCCSSDEAGIRAHSKTNSDNGDPPGVPASTFARKNLDGEDDASESPLGSTTTSNLFKIKLLKLCRRGAVHVHQIRLYERSSLLYTQREPRATFVAQSNHSSWLVPPCACASAGPSLEFYELRYGHSTHRDTLKNASSRAFLDSTCLLVNRHVTAFPPSAFAVRSFLGLFSVVELESLLVKLDLSKPPLLAIVNRVRFLGRYRSSLSDQVKLDSASPTSRRFGPGHMPTAAFTGLVDSRGYFRAALRLRGRVWFQVSFRGASEALEKCFRGFLPRGERRATGGIQICVRDGSRRRRLVAERA
ncbi:Mannosyltransferase [Mycena chlorophos]|uniref:Mannosyltransferase n=1 Tax=Mycena chlorophos TaxID=658473 RepID=A0A8H6RZE1_MYCCL|nr:Mannosyltransferase [Mycena chlorophos]